MPVIMPSPVPGMVNALRMLGGGGGGGGAGGLWRNPIHEKTLPSPPPPLLLLDPTSLSISLPISHSFYLSISPSTWPVD